MKILVMGAGALGSAFGGMLANAGNDVILIGREIPEACKGTGT